MMLSKSPFYGLPGSGPGQQKGMKPNDIPIHDHREGRGGLTLQGQRPPPPREQLTTTATHRAVKSMPP